MLTEKNSKHILITGGAGFIGTHLARILSKYGHLVRIFDVLTPQIHGSEAMYSAELRRDAECVVGDVIDRLTLANALRNIDVVIHLAAETGMGQSQYEIERYYRTNILGTAMLLDILANTSHQVTRIIVASSARVYGEGPYLCDEHGRVFPPTRTSHQMFTQDWEMRCPICKKHVISTLCKEDDPLNPGSMYAATKEAQERMLHLFGQMYGIETVALRYQNVYGDGQALKNPYTGVMVTFCNRVRNGLSPEIFEDGQETRDFVHVTDVVNATCLAIEAPFVGNQTINIGSGSCNTILAVAQHIIQAFASSLEPKINGKYRIGEVRHMQADIQRAHVLLGYTPQVSLLEGIKRLVQWVNTQPLQVDQSTIAISELATRGLYKG